MEWEHLSVDEAERVLRHLEGIVSRARALQLEGLRELDGRQVAAGEGCRTMVEWTAGRLDLDTAAAASLVDASRRLAEPSDLTRALADGEATFDRVVAVAANPDHLGLSESLRYDVAGVRRRGAHRRRVTRMEEREGHEARFLVLQPSLDSSRWQLRGQLGAVAGQTVESALLGEADALPEHPDRRSGRRGQRMADALESVCARAAGSHPDAASGGNGGRVTVFVDAALAVPTGCEAGVRLDTGPRVGPDGLEEVLCGGVVETIAITPASPVRAGRSSRDIPPAVRRFVLHRDQARCTIDGCSSRSRLQPHHIRPRSQGGSHHPDNLTTLCWYHHHVAIHRSGYRIHPDTPPQRRRLLPPQPGPHPP